MFSATPLKKIPLTAVDLEDHPFSVPPFSDLTPLSASIQEVGLLAPPWLRSRAGKRWQVVTGLKRLLAVAQLGWEQVPARTLPAATPDFHCLLVSLYDNAFSRGFNLLEQAVLAARLLAHLEGPKVAASFLPCLGLPPSHALLEKLLSLTTLEAPLQQLAAQSRLGLTAAARLAAWAPRDREAVLPFLNGLPLSQSKQEEFLEGLELLARREGLTPKEILSRADLQQYLADTALTPQERAESVRRLLKGWLSPRLVAAQEAFQNALGRLGLRQHPRLRLQPPPAFEGPDFHLEVRFRDAEELKRLLKELTRLVQEEEFSHLTQF